MKIQPKVFLTEVFGNPLGSWTSAPSGHGYPRPNAWFSRILSTLAEVLGRDICANDPRMSAGCPSQKLTLWAEISFLKFTVCTSRFSHSLIRGLCVFFASNSRFMRLFQAALDTPLDSPFSATLSVHGLHFTVCASSMTRE